MQRSLVISSDEYWQSIEDSIGQRNVPQQSRHPREKDMDWSQSTGPLVIEQCPMRRTYNILHLLCLASFYFLNKYFYLYSGHIFF